MYRKITGAGNDSHVTQVLYGGGPADQLGRRALDRGLHRHDRRADRRPALEHRGRGARQDRLRAPDRLTDDPGVKEALGFLMTREVAHQKSFEKALYSISRTSRRAKCRRSALCQHLLQHVQGPGEMRGPWNQGENWDFVTDREKQMAVDGGSNGRAARSGRRGGCRDGGAHCLGPGERSANRRRAGDVRGSRLGSAELRVEQVLRRDS
jgi:Mn-containing catalase